MCKNVLCGVILPPARGSVKIVVEHENDIHIIQFMQVMWAIVTIVGPIISKTISNTITIVLLYFGQY